MDEALIWYYVGQVRFDFHLLSNAGAGAEIPIKAALEEYGEADPHGWSTAINDALHWDATTANGFPSKDDNPAALEVARHLLTDFRDTIPSEGPDLQP